MECPFQAGQKVVCVREGWHRLDTELNPVLGPGAEFPQVNTIYTVTWVGPLPFGMNDIFIGLKEMPVECAYRAGGFRPLNDRPKEADTDISVFTKLLDAKKLEDVQ